MVQNALTNRKVAVIVNPASQNGATGRLWSRMHTPLQEVVGSFETCLTASAGDATRLTREQLHRGADVIISVGGDGTTNEIVNGFMEDDRPINPTALLIIIPSGTGGDLKRTLKIPKDPLQAIEALPRGSILSADLGRMEAHTQDGTPFSRYFINIASCGMSAEVVDRVNRSTKALGGKTSFLLGTMRALVRYRKRLVSVQIDDLVDESFPVTFLAVANAQYFGGGMRIAPEAVLNDGLLDIVLIGDVGKMRILGQMRRVFKGTHLELKGVSTWRGQSVTLTPSSEQQMVYIEIDGEAGGRLPARFTVIPSAINVLRHES